MQESIESDNTNFDWRNYKAGEWNLPPEIEEKLDELANLVNEDSEFGADFLDALKKGQYRQPILSLISYSRGVITQEEMALLHEAVIEANPN